MNLDPTLDPALDPTRGRASTKTDEWLAAMRPAWKGAIDRDEREECAASARRLARAVAPEQEQERHTLRDFVTLAACVVACVVGVMWLRQTMTAPRALTILEIRADEAQAAEAREAQETPPAPPLATRADIEGPAPAVATAVSGTLPASSTRPALAPPAKKSETEALPSLPPLPRPTPSTDHTDDDRRKMKRFELRIDRSWQRRQPPQAPHVRLPGRLPPGHVRDL